MSDRQSGTVKWFNNAKGSVLLRWPTDPTTYSYTSERFRVMVTAVWNEGQEVEFTLVEGPQRSAGRRSHQALIPDTAKVC